MNSFKAMNTTESKSTRRRFIHHSTTAAAAGTLASSLAFPSVSVGAPNDRRLKIGWVGCGGRGSGAINQALTADKNIELWAMGEVFKDKIDSAYQRINTIHPGQVNVQEYRKFVGLNAFQEVIDSGIDAIILTTSPGFRPQHIKAAVDAGVHVFCEKPMATDAPGLRSVIDSVRRAKEKGLTMVDGFVWRYTIAQRETYQRILGGELGDITAIHSAYNSGSTDRYPKFTRENCRTDLEYQLRRWYYFTWLSGDHIVEQAVHSIDKMLWAAGDQPPESCIASGGRQVRTEEKYGNIYDHFSVEYKWANGIRGYHNSRQMNACAGGVLDNVFGSKGVYHGNSGRRHHVFTGANPWRWKGERNNGYQTEHDEMYQAIRTDRPLNTGDRFVQTTLMAMMGRMAAYTGKEITWDMALNSKEKLVPDNLEWGMDLPVRPVAMPGKTKFI